MSGPFPPARIWCRFDLAAAASTSDGNRLPYVGDVVTGMNRQGYWLHLSNIDAGAWRATFSRDAMISADGFGAGATPWRAVQRAAWGALKQEDSR